jgi:hypothetical protein
MLACAVLGPAAGSAKTIDPASPANQQQSSPSVSKASAAINADSPRLLQLFRQLHAQTRQERLGAAGARALAAELASCGFAVQLGRQGTLVVAIMRNGAGPTLVYRADRGRGAGAAGHANAKRRSTRSNRPGAHGPGSEHGYPGDANLAWLLGMARAVSTLRADWAGTLVLVSEAAPRDDDSESAASGPHAAALGLPAPDVVLALGASSAPLGSMLGVRGRRRPGTDSVDISVHRFGAYDATPHLNSGRELASATIRRYGVPDDASFGYVLVGVAESSQASDAPSVLESAPFGEEDAVSIDLAAIPLGAKVATVAVLELLARARPRARNAASQWTLHQY